MAKLRPEQGPAQRLFVFGAGAWPDSLDGSTEVLSPASRQRLNAVGRYHRFTLPEAWSGLVVCSGGVDSAGKPTDPEIMTRYLRSYQGIAAARSRTVDYSPNPFTLFQTVVAAGYITENHAFTPEEPLGLVANSSYIKRIAAPIARRIFAIDEAAVVAISGERPPLDRWMQQRIASWAVQTALERVRPVAHDTESLAEAAQVYDICQAYAYGERSVPTMGY